MIKQYYLLTKPGIIYSNTFTAIAGFFMASEGKINLIDLIAMALGLSLIIASACVFNNYFDKEIDTKMTRTKSRPLVKGTITPRQALIFACSLGLLGMITLAYFVNLLSLIVSLIGFFFYVVAYTFGKRITRFGTEIGSISGAVPPVVGYTAVTGRLDSASLVLFFILVCWQMPHFYAIAIYRNSDYASAGIPVLPLKKGFTYTKNLISAYIAAFIILSLLPFFLGYSGFIYAFVMASVGIFWLLNSLGGKDNQDKIKWARHVFKISLMVIMVWSIMLALDAFLPVH